MFSSFITFYQNYCCFIFRLIITHTSAGSIVSRKAIQILCLVWDFKVTEPNFDGRSMKSIICNANSKYCVGPSIMEKRNGSASNNNETYSGQLFPISISSVMHPKPQLCSKDYKHARDQYKTTIPMSTSIAAAAIHGYASTVNKVVMTSSSTTKPAAVAGCNQPPDSRCKTDGDPNQAFIGHF